MITFVTVGSMAPFDSLIREADLLKAEGIIEGKLVTQIGDGKYIPRNAEWFRFAPSLIPYIEQADLIITHSGSGTLGEILDLHKKAISVPNHDIDDTFEFPMRLAREGCILFCAHLDHLGLFVEYAETWTPLPFTCAIAPMISAYLGGDEQ